MKAIFIVFLFLLISVVHSGGPESEKCVKHIIPEVGKCDAEIGKIDKDCAKAYKDADNQCKGNDSLECLTKYLEISKTCKKKRKVHNKRCAPLYASVKKDCSGAHVAPATGPESERCVKILVAQLATCDKQIAAIDKYCNEATQKIDADCKGKDTDECGNRYSKLHSECDSKRKPHTAKCGPIYAAHKKECLGITSAPATGPESDRCVKQLLPAVTSCDAEIGAIDKDCAKQYRDADRDCKGKDTLECLKRYTELEKKCKAKRSTYNSKCTPIYASHKKECTGVPSAPATGPDSDRCVKQLVPAVAVCDAKVVKIDNHCNRGFRQIDRECQGKDTDECGARYSQLTAECDGKRTTYNNKCGATMAAYKAECTSTSG